MSALRIARHEWKLVLKEPRFLIPFFITPMLLVGVQGYALTAHPAGAWETLMLARSLMLMLAALASSLAVPLGADTFAGERERNTFEILLCLPVPVRTLFWGKVLGIFPLPVLVGWMGQCAILLLLRMHGLLLPEFASPAIRTLLFTPVLGLFFCSLAALVSMRAESVRGAAQLTGLFMLVVLFSLLFASEGIFSSAAYCAGALAILLGGAGLCLRLASRRFVKLS
jgi:ABC-type Na+ efflux pump permease subunit